MSSAFLFLSILIGTFFISADVFASTVCPWVNWRGSQFADFSYDKNRNIQLTPKQVAEDLSCLRVVLATQYAWQGALPLSDLLSKIDVAIARPKTATNHEMLEQIFSYHEGYTDLHLSYQAGEVSKRFHSKNPVTVKLSEELVDEKIYERTQFTYFKPGQLTPELSSEQSRFIEYSKNHDRPLVIDLRGNGGGNNEFAKSLVESLFTSDQKAPGIESVQIESGLQGLGFCNTASIVYGRDEVKNFCNPIRDRTKGLSFSDLIKINVTRTPLKYYGYRPLPFQSAIILITDSGCASACETIVEKLSAHPKTKIIGTHTYGALHFGNAISLLLPHSGIWLAIPTHQEIYENDAPEGYGYSPDITATYIDLDKILFLVSPQ